MSNRSRRLVTKAMKRRRRFHSPNKAPGSGERNASFGALDAAGQWRYHSTRKGAEANKGYYRKLARKSLSKSKKMTKQSKHAGFKLPESFVTETGAVKRQNKAAKKAWRQGVEKFKVGVRLPRSPSTGSQLRDKAAYYRWSAQRGHAPAGNDPLSGRPKEPAWKQPKHDQDAYKASHKAMARSYIKAAKTHRMKNPRKKLPESWVVVSQFTEAYERRRRLKQVRKAAFKSMRAGNRMLPQKGHWDLPTWSKTSKRMSNKEDKRRDHYLRADKALQSYSAHRKAKKKWRVSSGYKVYQKKDRWGRDEQRVRVNPMKPVRKKD